jgi:SMODS and SLOG-associating 2TM effector domain 3
MQNSDFPSYFQASDTASIETQKNYVNIIRIDLLLMILASALTIYNYELEVSKLSIYIISGLLLLISLILTIILKTKKYEDVWYQGRALAESCKTLTWRFVCCSEYFENSIDITEVKKGLLKE